MKNAEKLLAACKKSLAENEYNVRKIKGVSLTHSDVETAMLYAETILRCGSYRGELMTPRGEVRELLDKFSLLEVSA